MKTNNPTLADLLHQIGRKLYATRRIKDEKLDSVASSTGISKTVISDIENGKYTSLNFDAALKLANYHGVHLKDLLGEAIGDDHGTNAPN